MQEEKIWEAGTRKVKWSDCHRNVEKVLKGQGEGEQLLALEVPLTCEWRGSVLEERLSGKPGGFSSLGQSNTLTSGQAWKELFVPTRETLVLQKVPGQGAQKVPQVLSL